MSPFILPLDFPHAYPPLSYRIYLPRAYAPLCEGEAQVDAGLLRHSSPRTSHMAHLLRAVPEIPQEADKTREAIRLVVAAEEAGGGDRLREARGLLHTPDAQSAAHALIALGDVAKGTGDQY